MSHPAYKPPPCFVLRLRLQKGGSYLRDTTVSYDVYSAEDGFKKQKQLDKVVHSSCRPIYTDNHCPWLVSMAATLMLRYDLFACAYVDFLIGLNNSCRRHTL